MPGAQRGCQHPQSNQGRRGAQLKIRQDFLQRSAGVGDRVVVLEDARTAVLQRENQVVLRVRKAAGAGAALQQGQSAIAEHIKNIRAKLRAAGQEPIETVWGVGYKWQ